MMAPWFPGGGMLKSLPFAQSHLHHQALRKDYQKTSPQASEPTHMLVRDTAPPPPWLEIHTPYEPVPVPHPRCATVGP